MERPLQIGIYDLPKGWSLAEKIRYNTDIERMEKWFVWRLEQIGESDLSGWDFIYELIKELKGED